MIEYAEYLTAFKQWAYTQTWIDHLVDQLKGEERFERITGKPARKPAE